MRSRITDRNIWLVYATIFLLGIAYGVSLAVLALFLDARQFTKGDIGLLAACFALGIVSLSLPMGGLIRRYSARTTLAISLVGYAVTVATFPFLRGFPSVAAARFVDGAFSVGVWVSCETILLSRATSTNKAFVTSLYAISMAVGYVIGPVVARVIVALSTMRTAFVVAGVLGALAGAVIIRFLAGDVPETHHAAAPGKANSDAPALHVGLALLKRIKTSCFATFAYGYFQASVVLFLPLYLVESKGIRPEQTIYVPAFFAAGMLLFSNVAARLGDRYGHLFVMRVLGGIGATMVLAFVYLDSFALMCAAVFVAGATLASISPVSLALQGVIAAPSEYSRSNAIYNAFYACGMLIGPPASSRLYQLRGGVAMLYHLAALWALFVLFAWVYLRDDPGRRRASAA